MKFIFATPIMLYTLLVPSPGWTASMDESKRELPGATVKSSIKRILTQVDLKDDVGTLIKITGDGPFSYRIVSLGADRVIVDLINTSTKLGRTFAFNNPMVKQVRLGQHPNLLRLVIDLQQSATYSVQEDKNTLSVTLAPRTTINRLVDAGIPSQNTKAIESIRIETPIVRTTTEPTLTASSEQPRQFTLGSERATTEPSRHPEVRRRAADRHMVEQPTIQPKTETYVAAFGGFSLSQSFTSVHGIGANSSVDVSDLALSRTGIGGVKAGFSPSTAKWMAIETELFYASPHFKQQNVTVTGSSGTATGDFAGSHTRVATWAFNWILRYPGEWVQPYAGAGLGLFWGRLADSGGASSSDASPGLNALAGIRAKIGQHFLVFTEYKYNRTSFDFSSANFHVLYQAHYVVGGLGWSF